MHFSTIAASVALVGTAMAGSGYYESPEYYTADEKVYTSVSTCTGKETKPTEPSYAPEYPSSSVAPYPTTSVEPYPTYAPEYPSSSVATYPIVYTSYEKVTDHGKTYTSTAYSTCSYGSPDYPAPSAPAYPEEKPPVYYPHGNETVPEYPAEYPPKEEHPYPTTDVPEVPHYTTVYTTVCPGKDYCYATTVSEYPKPTKPAYPVPETPEYPAPSKPAYPVPDYSKPAPAPPTYTQPPVYEQPPKGNETYPAPPPSYTGAASTTGFSFGVAAIAAVAALFIAA